MLVNTMQATTLIFPHQLFKQHPAVQKERAVYLVEEELYFNQYNFHRQNVSTFFGRPGNRSVLY